jgi:hypothetical protein
MANSSPIKIISRFALLAALCAFAFFDFSHAGMVRRTFLFYTYDRGLAVVESRMLPRSASPELEITRYVEEALSGPASLSLAPLLDRETKLRTLMYRDGTVFADFSQIAALPVPEAKTDAVTGLLTLDRGIRRNFPYVTGVKLFIEGNEVFF